MVTIIDYALRQSKDGKEFVSLQMQGDVELLQSLKTGRFYATARRCTMSSTFDEEMAKRLIGKQFPGSIIRVEAEAYDYTVPETGEVITLAHSYQYSPEDKPYQTGEIVNTPRVLSNVE